MRSSLPSTLRSSKFAEDAALAVAVAEHGQRLRRRANVVAIGVGVAYRESVGRFADGDTQGHRPPLALKAIVKRKPKRLAPRDRLPRSVRVRVTENGRIRNVRVPVDIVLQGEVISGPGVSDVLAIDQADYPHTGFPAPGHRFFAGHADDSVEAVPGLPPEYAWDIGTVGAIVTDGQRRYAVTAGHVLTDPYGPGAAFPAHCRVGFALEDTGLASDNPEAPVPAVPRDGAFVVDVVALPLTAQQSELSEQEAFGVASGSELAHFRGQGAALRVERGHAIIDLPATVEGYFDEFNGTMDGKNVRFGPTLLLRCGGALPVQGDSGAPVIARHPVNGSPTLLGFHIGRTEGSSTSAPVCYVMAAAPLFARTSLGLV
jgi:hypothetical protein